VTLPHNECSYKRASKLQNRRILSTVSALAYTAVETGVQEINLLSLALERKAYILSKVQGYIYISLQKIVEGIVYTVRKIGFYVLITSQLSNVVLNKI
jgi:hypothetical protein